MIIISPFLTTIMRILSPADQWEHGGNLLATRLQLTVALLLGWSHLAFDHRLLKPRVKFGLLFTTIRQIRDIIGILMLLMLTGFKRQAVMLLLGHRIPVIVILPPTDRNTISTSPYSLTAAFQDMAEQKPQHSITSMTLVTPVIT